MIKNTKIFSITKRLRWKKVFRVIRGTYRKLKDPKIPYILEKTSVLSIICSECENKDDKRFKEEESIEILKILGLIKNTQLL